MDRKRERSSQSRTVITDGDGRETGEEDKSLQNVSIHRLAGRRNGFGSALAASWPGFRLGWEVEKLNYPLMAFLVNKRTALRSTASWRAVSTSGFVTLWTNGY